jgi:Ca-activated chloride channel family protein
VLRFANPYAWQLLWVIPIILVLIVISSRQSRKILMQAFGTKHFSFLCASLSLQKRRVKRSLRVVTLVLMIITLARPQSGFRKEEVKSQGVELMFLVDVSTSMMAEDVKPSRLEQVKGDLTRLLDLMPGNRVGIVAFAGSAVVLSPLTNDLNALKMYIDSLSPDSVSDQGTQFSDALVAAEQAFKRGGDVDDEKSKTTRVILMASDGEDQEPGALDVVKQLADKGVRLFTVAYGTEKGAPVPQRDSLGFLQGYKKDDSGKMILSQVHGDVLRELAKTGGGSFFHASFGGNYLSNIVEDINKLEKAEFESKTATQYDEKFQVVLFFAIVLTLLELLLSERRSSFRLWQGRFEVPKE